MNYTGDVFERSCVWEEFLRKVLTDYGKVSDIYFKLKYNY